VKSAVGCCTAIIGPQLRIHIMAAERGEITSAAEVLNRMTRSAGA
jgi:hypothetical protein